ncbi:MAG: hypothetical protein ACOCX3_03865 [Chloroflexota bacterium]
MRFTLYTEKTPAQCLRDLNERMQAKPTKTNPELGGWIDKKGRFSITLSSRVFGRIPRTTRLSARLERERGVTVIEGYVSDGLSPEWLRNLSVILLVVVGALIFSGEPMLALFTLLLGIVAAVLLYGDWINSDVLLKTVEKTLKADPKPPKK